MSRCLFATIESRKDVSDFVKGITSWFSAPKENLEIYPDPTGDPMKHDRQKKQRLVRSSCWLLRRSLHDIQDLFDAADYPLSRLRKGAIPKYIH